MTAAQPREQAAADSLRDLMGLLALPALWAGKDGETILNVMADAARRVAPVQVALAEVALPGAGESRLMVKIGDAPFTADVPAEWRELADERSGRLALLDRDPAPTRELGSLRWARLHLGAGARSERIWFGSRDPAFPRPTDTAFLRAAASLAASGLAAAKIDFERAKAAQAKDEFLAMLGHELRNPLAPIVTSLQLIEMKGAGAVAREVDVIRRQVGNLGRLVDDLLDIARITRDKVELRMENVDLRESLAAALESAAPLMEAKGHRVAVDVPTGLRVVGDPARLRQIFSNLLINAAKFTDPGGRVDVSARASGGRVAVTVRDNGAGMPRELLPRVFDLFEQGLRGADRKGGGLGIGLAIVKRLAELHGGSATARSAGPGAGSEFRVDLPLAPERSEPEAAPQAGRGLEPSARGRRIMLVDDNRDALDSLAQLLELGGHVVSAAESPAEALRRAPSFCADVYILDIGLPGMDGYELAAELRRACGAEGAQFLALTGYGQASDKERAALGGFHGHLTKPVAIAELFAMVDSLPRSRGTSPSAAEPAGSTPRAAGG